jgi:sialidase-1
MPATSTIIAFLVAGLASVGSAAVIAHWQFNEQSPGVTVSAATNSVLDASGNRHHLTADGSPLPKYTDGSPLFGGTPALNFTVGTERLRLTETSAFNFNTSDSFTIEAVLKTAAGASFTGNIVGRDWGSRLPSWWFRLEGGIPRFLIAQAGGPEPSVTANTLVNDGNWHHVAAVRDGSDRKLRIYVDHLLAGEANDSTTAPSTNAQNLVVGAFNSGSRQFEGAIDFIRINQGALPPAEFIQPSLLITDVQPTNGATFFAPTNVLRFTVLAQSGVEITNIEFTLNGSNRTSDLAISGTDYRRVAQFSGLAADGAYKAMIGVVDRMGHRVERQLKFDTYAGHTVPVFVRGESDYHTYRIPALLVTTQATLLAFAEARKNSSSDAGDIDLVLKRSFDNGRTWSAMSLIWSDAANTIGNPCPVVDRVTGTIWLPFCRNNSRVFVTKSTDDGATWATPAEITGTTKPANWGWYATGPGVGIQLEHGPHRGRMVIPSDHNATEGTNKIAGSHVIFSDDHGQTWQLGGVIAPGVNECQVVELADGRLLMNMRNSGSANTTRAIASSADGGITWSAITHDSALIEPVCQASFLRYTRAAEYGRNRLVFSNPGSTSSRVNLTVRLSYDEGQTWPIARTLHAAATAYSCLAVLPDLTLGCLYEAGLSNPYETITFARFSLAWLTGGADRSNRRRVELRPAGAQLLLSWPAEYAGADLEASAALGAGQPWIPIAVEPAVVDHRRQVVLNAEANQRFFRLVWTSPEPLAADWIAPAGSTGK